MSNLQYSKLVLKSSDLTLGAYNQFGECDALRNKFTFFNVDLRILMGNMYDKYETFNLSLNTFFSSMAVLGANPDLNDTQLLLNISGLQFLNQTYSQVTGNNSSTATIASVYFVNNVCTYQTFNNNFITFGKSQEKCNITIEYLRVDGASPETELPNVVFIFDIIGIPKENEMNSTRLF